MSQPWASVANRYVKNGSNPERQRNDPQKLSSHSNYPFPRSQSATKLDTGKVQVDPVILSLDDTEDVSDWINGVLASQAASSSTSGSSPALELKLEGLSQQESLASHSSFSRPPPGSREHLSSLDSTLASLSTNLSLARQDTTANIDSNISDVTKSIPKLGLELRLMKDAAVTLKEKVKILSTEASASAGIGEQEVQSSAVHSLERLSILSSLRQRMSAARDVLSLAESWSTLSNDVSTHLAESKFDLAALRLAEAKSSLPVFERTPEFGVRKDLLINLTNSLESSITPLLVTAIEQRNLIECQKIASILQNVDRAKEFGEHWRKNRRAGLLAEWKSARVEEDSGPILKESGTNFSTSSFVDLLPRFFSALVTLLNEERLYAPTLFASNPRNSLEVFVTSAIEATEPSLKERLDRSAKNHVGSALLMLVKAHNIIKEAANNIERILARMAVAELDPLPPTFHPSPMGGTSDRPLAHSPQHDLQVAAGPPSPTDAPPRRSSLPRRQSRRLSLNPTRKGSTGSEWDVNLPVSAGSGEDSLHVSLPTPALWLKAMFEPLLPYQTMYSSFETRLLADEWQKEALARHSSVSKTQESNNSVLLGSHIARQLRDDTQAATGLAEDATLRTIAFTYGLGTVGLVDAVDSLFTRVFDGARHTLQSSAAKAAETARRQAAAALARASSGTLSLTGFEAASVGGAGGDEWTAFEEGVSLMSVVHEAYLKLERLERLMSSRLLDVAETVLGSGTWNGGEALRRLCGEGTANGVPKGALTLLVEATDLKSPPLRSYLDTVRAIAKASPSTPTTTLSSLPMHDFSIVSKQHLSSPARQLLSGARSSLFSHLRSLQRHQVDIILSPLMPHLESYPNLSAWEASRLPGAVNEYELAMPTFSLSPTETMSRIGEGLLDLPRLLEVWAEDRSLAWGLDGLPHIAEERRASYLGQSGTGGFDASQSGEFATPTPGSTTSRRTSFNPDASTLANSQHQSVQPPVSPTVERRANSHRHSASVAAIATSEPSPSHHQNASPEQSHKDGSSSVSPENILQSYVKSLCLTLLSHLTSLVLPSFHKLTSAGAAQLVADLEYLINILSALNVEAPIDAVFPLSNPSSNGPSHLSSSAAVTLIRTLEAWRDCARLNDVDGRRMKGALLRRRSGTSGLENVSVGSVGEMDEDRTRSLIQTEAFDMVSRLRSW